MLTVILWRLIVLGFGVFMVITGLFHTGTYHKLHPETDEKPAHPPTLLGRVLFTTAGGVLIWIALTNRVK